MIVPQLADFLKEHKVDFEIIPHPQRFSALDTAKSAHVKSHDMVKTLMLWVDGEMSMMLLPANMHMDFEEFSRATNSRTVRMASESEFHLCFPECELGAQPAIGNLFELPVYVALPLTQHEYIVFNGGNHHELVKMGWHDFFELVQPIIIHQGFSKIMNASYKGNVIISHFH